MKSRASVMVPAAVLLWVGAVLASCGGDDKKPPPNPSGGTTTSTGTMGQGGGTGGSGEGGSGMGGSGAGGSGQGGSGQGGSGQGGSGGGMVDPTCTDGAQNGLETDVDCGGIVCPACADGAACVASTDCTSRRCEGVVCQAASCSNGVVDGDETGVDCGGATMPTGTNPACPPCPELQPCNVGEDCQSSSCVNGVCLPPTCSDGVQNGAETDIDCGGQCGGCAPGMSCAVSDDCTERVCVSNVCLPASCSDQVKNGAETDIDCGGTCTSKCPPGQKCLQDSDCRTGDCDTISNPKVCLCPPGMVVAPVIGGGSYCIDAYEVSNEDYADFLAANPNLANLPPICAGNIYTPLDGWPYSPGAVRVPVTYVDWCDAYAYCAYSNKHLCGDIGGGMNDPANHAVATESEWFNACSAQGVNVYPYGGSFDAAKCNDQGVNSAPVEKPPVGQPPPACQGGIVGLYHMSGNVAEWESSCDAGWQCRIRGGSFASGMGEVMCAADAMQLHSVKNAQTGFRCCL